MAGNSGALTARICACVLLASAPSSAQRSADVLIVEHPGALVVYNRYQQLAGPGEKRNIPPFSPIVILREHDVLGDGFTPCATVEIEHQQFYLGRDTSGELAASGDPGSTRLLRDVVLEGDTAVLLGGKALRLRRPGPGQSAELPGKTRALLLFEHAGETYVRLLPPGNGYGWLDLRRPSEWRRVETASRSSTSAAEVMSRLRGVVERANGTLRSVYRSLAPRRAVPPPSFLLSGSGREIRCTIEPDSLAGAFRGSIGALLGEFDRVLGGTGLHAESSDGVIRISLE